ncbi:hypothetical protein RND71_036797 [Anisodus tanguticus]|uniref:Retrovirus-related Pol polyprotein from transposon TNT 1-94-like beta-barrel domain-containing protein n=1 Tax=Anisodus tanguticus TaxID=243964 RepID=A0AAE1UT24_9SOLA|nr:hypothetical protein RND71_036797 [Anisodus tanguticus]
MAQEQHKHKQLENSMTHQQVDKSSLQQHYHGPVQGAGMMFTPEQYDQILKMIYKGVPQDYDKSGAGMTQIFLATKSEAFRKWIIDYGATNHVVCSEELLDGIKQITKDNIIRVYLPDGHALEIACVGKCKLNNDDTISNVPCVP